MSKIDEEYCLGSQLVAGFNRSLKALEAIEAQAHSIARNSAARRQKYLNTLVDSAGERLDLLDALEYLSSSNSSVRPF